MSFRKYIIISFVLTLFTSCFKEDKAITLPDTEFEVMTVFMGEGFQKQMYFNLENLSYETVMLTAWDLAFDNNTNDCRIVTNYGRNIFIHPTNTFSVDEVKQIDITKLGVKDWLYDFPSGNLDSNAFGDWRKIYNDNMPYHIIDLGREIKDKEQRYYFFRVKSVDNDEFKIEIGKIFSDSPAEEVIIPRAKSRNYSFLNIGEMKVETELEPNKTDWDFVFSRYRYIFYGIDPKPLDPFPYMVTGVLLNPSGVEVAIDSTKGFNKINLDYSKSLDFSDRQDIIGYAWKNFDYDVTFTYTMNPDIVYIIRNRNGSYFKIRFLDFINENKKTGYPKFEVQRIFK